MRFDRFIKASFIVCVILFTGCRSEDRELYDHAVRSAKSGDKDFAFMYYTQILRDYPKSQITESVLFAQAEYYAFLPDYKQASALFNRFIREYPNSKTKLFVLGHLLRIAEIQKDPQRIQELKKEITTFKQVSFVFRDFKEFKYISPCSGKYSAIFRIDTVEFFLEGELFAKVSF